MSFTNFAAFTRENGFSTGSGVGRALLVLMEPLTLARMASPKSSFLDKVLGRIGRPDAEGLQTVIQRLARERSFLETLFDVIEDGVLVADEQGRVIYFNESVTTLLGLRHDEAEGQPITRFLPGLDWKKLARWDRQGGPQVVRHELEVEWPRPRFLRLYAAPLGVAPRVCVCVGPRFFRLGAVHFCQQLKIGRAHV